MPERQGQEGYYRFCPGEERFKLSDAVCRGRRRGHYPKCKGCQFNEDERVGSPRASIAVAGAVALSSPLPSAASPTARPASPKRDQIETLFKANDIRGVYPDPLSAESAWRIGMAIAQFLRSELRGYDRGRPDKSTVIVGRDMRRSSPDLAEALIGGLQAGGAAVIDIGMVDTPQLYFAVNRLVCCGGVQVTASHNPGNYNGFKVCGQKARPVSADTGLSKIGKIAKNTLRYSGTAQASRETRDLTADYKAFVRAFLKEEGHLVNGDRPFQVVVDASNGMAGRWFPVLFGDIDWLEVVPLNFEHNGEFVHEPDPIDEANLAQLRDRMVRSKADLGICFDGDADRCILVDGQGIPVRGDLVTALLAPYFLREFPNSTVVYDVRSSRVVPEEIRKGGGQPRRERCGHAFVKKTLADTRGAFAGELSGHYYFRENFFCDSAMIAFAEVLNLLNLTGQPLGELIAPLRRYASSGQITFRCQDPKATFKHLGREYADAEIDYLDGITVQYEDWWFNVRQTITMDEPVVRVSVEAFGQKALDARVEEVCRKMEEAGNARLS
ncbi:MAG TPA: phosphomannomutase/phosphoglucomutase [Phycisphaerae bacterium]|nr:phosphomannomutase/phosphoglucomutase [Phycisphaerae bacterium]HRY68229.1 phosphomannomutase/phosphoglucomutase [Phycisphaerae bacterium]HSA28587.1 phosphomannomutase/phosphoglucomutase [Phycisphaerae bacterium]